MIQLIIFWLCSCIIFMSQGAIAFATRTTVNFAGTCTLYRRLSSNKLFVGRRSLLCMRGGSVSENKAGIPIRAKALAFLTDSLLANRELLSKMAREIVSRADRAIFIGLYILFAERAVRLIWRTLQHSDLKKSVQSSGNTTEFESSFLAAILPSSKILGLGMASLWVVDTSTALHSILRGVDHNAQGRFSFVVSKGFMIFVASRAAQALKNHACTKWLARYQPEQAASSQFVIRRVSDILLWGFSFLTFLDATGISMTRVLSFAGIGGLAVGLAAKDLASNLVGGPSLISPSTPPSSVASFSILIALILMLIN